MINRLGFNNLGLDVYVRNLTRLSGRTIPLGANVGINKEGADPARDYPALIKAVSPLGRLCRYQCVLAQHPGSARSAVRGSASFHSSRRSRNPGAAAHLGQDRPRLS